MFLIDTSTEFGKRVARQLEEEEILWLTTVDANGVPQPVPIWFLWDGETILFYSQPNKPKLRNIERNSRVSLNFNTEPMGEEVGVFIGTLAVDPTAPLANQSPEYQKKYGDGIIRIGYTNDTYSETWSVPLRFTPEKLRGQ
ncbi:MAG TPA: TIGR03667 family PPOX class F420-dependent oxidoreductase [Thermomicrobiales bacterium]|nr:TIGR03667 family PPOX class F420-dependent oxidoreductase [Thermomicrobiales bacterium]